MTSNDRNITIQTNWTTGLTQLDRQFNRTKTTKRKSPRFAFLKISANPHLAHLQSHTSQPATQALQKSAILPSLKKERY